MSNQKRIDNLTQRRNVLLKQLPEARRLGYGQGIWEKYETLQGKIRDLDRRIENAKAGKEDVL